MEDFFQIDWSFVDRIGDNPFVAMWFMIANGGWVIFVYMAWHLAKHLWKEWRQNLNSMKKSYVVLALEIPRVTEQGPRAVENMFAYLSGAHSAPSWTEEWILGLTQDTVSCELVSIDGNVQFYIRVVSKLRDLVEAAIYAQYPDAEIIEVTDYALGVPGKFPDEEWDMWGTELTPVKPDVFPIKTYEAFEDKIAMEFKDPLSALFESFARIGHGEQAWFQIVLTPIAQAGFHKKCDEMIKKLTGVPVVHKESLIEKIVTLPIKFVGMVLEGLLSNAPADGKHAKLAEKPQSKYGQLTKGEKDVIDAIHLKSSKMAYQVKLRFMYIAKKQVLSKARIVQPFIGAIKQFSSNTMQALKPETKHVGVNGNLWWFKDKRNNQRKNHLMHAYRSRSNWAGLPAFHMTVDELATIWHFPHSVQIKAPQMKKTQAKRMEPPTNLPFG